MAINSAEDAVGENNNPARKISLIKAERQGFAQEGIARIMLAA